MRFRNIAEPNAPHKSISLEFEIAGCKLDKNINLSSPPVPYSILANTFHVLNSLRFEVMHADLSLSEGGSETFYFQLVQPSLVKPKAEIW